jgi:hypothetical protein
MQRLVLLVETKYFTKDKIETMTWKGQKCDVIHYYWLGAIYFVKPANHVSVISTAIPFDVQTNIASWVAREN